MADYPHANLTHVIIDACYQVFRELESRDEAQLLNYLKCAGGGIGLLVNFGNHLEYKRRVMGNPEASLPSLA